MSLFEGDIKITINVEWGFHLAFLINSHYIQ